ncbi:hypothetical protein HanPSC8_Chr03g0098151 [Helianthus annuus]|nr:hypothetical protein HanPSC8_Chr03g0098151 [Helianthus annuus]
MTRFTYHIANLGSSRSCVGKEVSVIKKECSEHSGGIPAKNGEKQPINKARINLNKHKINLKQPKLALNEPKTCLKPLKIVFLYYMPSLALSLFKRLVPRLYSLSAFMRLDSIAHIELPTLLNASRMNHRYVCAINQLNCWRHTITEAQPPYND